MVSKEYREQLKAKLPKPLSRGYDLIQEKLPHLTKDEIQKAFNDDKRYREEVIVTAIQVVAAEEKRVKDLENSIQS